jgi:hypothetical protein
MDTKVLLSAEELSLVQNTHWLLTKNNIIEKAKVMFGSLAASLQKEVEQQKDKLPEAIHLFSPKVFKGEYYQGLPYVMLDYPRVFSRDDVFALRTMFWWGNFFSVTLQLKGSYQRLFAPVLLEKRAKLARRGCYVCVSADEWRHDFEPSNYERIQLTGTNLERAAGGEFVKIAVQVPLLQWNEALQLLMAHQKFMIELLAG